MAGNVNAQKGDSTYLRLLKGTKKDRNMLKTNIHVTVPVIKTYSIPVTKPYIASADDKLLSNVQVYPNPVTDQINLKYMISRSSSINIKIMDVLGNEVATIFSQRVEAGEQKFTYSLSNKLNSGFYFVRIVVGTESVIKRISIIQG